MTKPTITRIWLIGLFVLAAGLIVGGVGLGLLLTQGGQYTQAASGNGYDFVPTIDGFFWTTVSLMIIGFTAAAAGGIVQLAAWIGAVINTNQLQDKTWFFVLLVGGVIGLAFSLVGFGVMVAYLVAGPDGTMEQRPHAQIPSQPPSMYAPT